MMKADDGVAPVVAVALLIGLVAVAGAIIGLTMFAALEDATGTLPDVRFQSSADDHLLYHAGGEVLYKKELVFYDTSKGSEKNSANISDKVEIDGNTDWTTWSTGQAIKTPESTNVSMLSVVGLDSRNVPVMLWMGANAVALPVGDMVPDEWVVQEGESGERPKPVPTPTYPGYHPGVKLDNKDKITFTIGDETYNLLTNEHKVDQSNHQVPLPATVTSTPYVLVVSQDGNSNLNVTVTIYDPYSNDPNDSSKANTVFGPKSVIADHQKKDGTQIRIDISLQKGYVCHVTIIDTHNNGETEYDTAVITFT